MWLLLRGGLIFFRDCVVYWLMLCFCFRGAIKNWGWASGGSSVLAEFGSLHLEFQYLTYLSGNQVYLDKVSSKINTSLNEETRRDSKQTNWLMSKMAI